MRKCGEAILVSWKPPSWEDFSMNRNYFEDLQVVCYVLGRACMSNGYKLLVWFLLNRA